jgi:hypothetical protein
MTNYRTTADYFRRGVAGLRKINAVTGDRHPTFALTGSLAGLMPATPSEYLVASSATFLPEESIN